MTRNVPARSWLLVGAGLVLLAWLWLDGRRDEKRMRETHGPFDVAVASTEQDAAALPLGEALEGKLELTPKARRWYLLEVPQDAKSLRLSLSSPEADLDLFAAREMVADLHTAAFGSATEWGDEQLWLFRYDNAAGLQPGTWFVCVSSPWSEEPRQGSERVDEAQFELRADVAGARVDASLKLGQSIEVWVEPDAGSFHTLAVEVGQGVRELRIDLAETEADLDLFLRPGQQILDVDASVHFAQNPWGCESILVEAAPGTALESGTWYVDVVDWMVPGLSSHARVFASSDGQVPADLARLPVLPSSAGLGVPRAQMGAVFELMRGPDVGSGTCISKTGLILTNAHVAGPIGSEVVLCASWDPGRPAVESFRCRVVHSDMALDLALVQIERGFHGQALPEGYTFPALTLETEREAQIGEPLWLIGYPTTGGTGSRVTISVTRGIVSGFVADGNGRAIKTDAVIAGGNSGGAALNERGHLIGVPTALIESGSGKIGYVQPLSAVPAEWLAGILPR